MRHSLQDAIDTAARRSATRAGTWHPLLAAIEVKPGHWYMVDATRKCYGIIRFLTIQGESGYRTVAWAERSEDRQLIGYYTSLRAAASACHQAFLRTHGHALPESRDSHLS